MTPFTAPPIRTRLRMCKEKPSEGRGEREPGDDTETDTTVTQLSVCATDTMSEGPDEPGADTSDRGGPVP